MTKQIDLIRIIVTKILEVTLAILLAMMVIFVFSNVVGRYIFSRAITWADELSRYSFIWLTFIGTTLGVFKGAHIGMDILIEKISEQKRQIFKIISVISILVFLLVWIRWGFKIAYMNRKFISPGTGIPMSYVYGIAPVMAILMACQFLTELYSSLIQLLKKRG